MLHTVQMQKIRLVALEEEKYYIIRELQRMGVVDIRKSSLGLADDEALKQIVEVSELLVKFRSALSFLKAPRREIKPEQQLQLPELLERCRSTTEVGEVNLLVEKKRELKERIKGTEDELSTASLFEGIDIDFGKLVSKVLAFRAFLADQKTAATLRQWVEQRGVRCEIVEGTREKKFIVFVAFDASQGSMIEEAVRQLKLNEVDMTDKYLDAKPRMVVAKLERQKDAEAREIAETDRRLAKMGEDHYIEIASLAEMLEAEYERSRISSSFKKTEHTFVLEGWVPKSKMDETYKRIKRATKQSFYIEEINDNELAPTLVARPKLFSEFDFLMDFYSLPRSDEIDPTWFFILSFMVFYGLMVSDFGYGVLSLLFATVIIKKTSPNGLMHNAARVWQIASIPIMVFGLVSNQFFGLQFAQFKGIMLVDWADIPSLLVITILMGVSQVCIGLALGFVNKFRHGEKLLALSKLTSIAALLAGTLSMVGYLFGVMTGFAYPSMIVAIAATVVTLATSGIEASEFTNLIAHPLSYARIFGFGLASIMIASLIDKGFTPTLSHGVLTFVALTAIFIILHAFNMLLSIFEGILQATRLNFVEFFSKFYKGGGVKFAPYRFERHYTKD